MSTPNALDDSSGKVPPFWPQDAVPEHWITELFKRMHRLWGNTFVDKWRDVEMAGMKIEWAKALKKLSSTELKAGVDALLTLKFPPSLPEFYGLCKQMRLVEPPPSKALTNQTKANPEMVEANLARMRAVRAAFMQQKEPNAEWAFRLLLRGATASGGAIGPDAVKCAYDAIVSSAGRRAIENCSDADRADFETLYRECVEGARSSGQPLWETP